MEGLLCFEQFSLSHTQRHSTAQQHNGNEQVALDAVSVVLLAVEDLVRRGVGTVVLVLPGTAAPQVELFQYK